MEPLIIHPVNTYKTAMHITLLIISILVAVPLLLLMLFIPDRGGQIAFGIILALFIAVMVPLALWIPFFHRSLFYEVGPEHVIMECGVFWKHRATVPYSKVTNVDTTQGPLERHFRFGTVHVQTAGAGGGQGAKAEVRLAGITDFNKLKDIVLKLVAVPDVNTASLSIEGSYPAEVPALERIHSELVAIRKAIERGNS